MARPSRRARASAGTSRKPDAVRMRMRSARSSVAPMVDRVMRAVEPAGLSQEQQDNLAVAVAEALSNAAVHGNKLDSRRQVRVCIQVTPRGDAMVEVADSGHGFDSGSVSDPTDPARVLIPGGRGVFLMKRLVDEIEYNDCGNCVRMTIHAGGKRR